MPNGTLNKVMQLNTYAKVPVIQGEGSSDPGCLRTLNIIIVTAMTSIIRVNHIARLLFFVTIQATIAINANANNSQFMEVLFIVPLMKDKINIVKLQPKKARDTKTEIRPPARYWAKNTIPFIIENTSQPNLLGLVLPI
jgi:hypothetical protein